MKKQLLKYSILIMALIFFVDNLPAERLAVPISSYGIWDRGGGVSDYSDPKVDYILGLESSDDWARIQSKGPDKFDFSIYQKAIDDAEKYNKKVKLSVGVGPASPTWLYDNGVPNVDVTSKKAEKHKKFADYPYYLNETYKKYYFELINQFALFLRKQPQSKFDCIGFVQVKTGATGDEKPYKGEPNNKSYKISKEEWEDFRISAFIQFKKCFNDVPDRQIALIFNNVDPENHKAAFDFLMTKLDPKIGFGIKGGAFNRGHHLSEEESYKNQWNPYLINPKGVKLFSASEMDQSWTKGYFSINTELNFYWAWLSGMNTGLSSINVTKNAIDYANKNDKIRDIFKMFNKYAQQVYPATSTAAVSIFHEGLDASDTVKFPESKYGVANRKNEDRYKNICAAYASRGAKMDDLQAAVLGQVYQRESQTGFNDAGWDIARGNYERFLTQINPDKTSIGLFRVRGIIDANSSKYDRFARSFENSTGKNTMYFKFHEETFAAAKPKDLKFTITWLDKSAGSTWALKYKSGNQLKTAIEVKGRGENQWKQVVVNITDMDLDRRGEFGSDFILANTDKIDDIFNGIEVDITR